MSTATVVRAAETLRIDGVAPKANKVAAWFVLIGALLTALFSLFHYERFWSAYLVGFTFILSITLGGLFFVIIQHLVRAGWSVVVRRVAEGIAYNMRFMPLLFIPLVLAIEMGYLQPQAAGDVAGHGPAVAAVGHEVEAPADGAEHATAEHATAEHAGSKLGSFKTGPHLENIAHGEMDHAKATYLNFAFSMLRYVIYFFVWIALSFFYFSTSVKQDESGDPALTNTMQRYAAPSMVIWALTMSLAGFDLLMSLDPHWYSTMFGVYFFSGCFVSFCAFLILTLYLLQRHGIITESVNAEHYHDVGKFMFAFIVFWAYIAYSQYMIIWYANIPEETSWYMVRQEGDWAYVGLFLVLGHFVVPFMLLLSRFAKRRPFLLALGAVYVLCVHWVDLFYIVQPQKSPLGVLPVPLLDVFLALAMFGLYIAFTVKSLKGINLIPIGDPRLGESLNHENY